GFLDKTGKETLVDVIPSGAYRDGMCPVQPLGMAKFGFIDTTGKMVIKPQFSDVEPFNEGLAAVAVKQDAWGFIDKTGKFVIKPLFVYIHSFREGLASIRVGDQWGVIDKSGKMVAKPQFAYLGEYWEGRCKVEKGRDHGFI